MTSRETRQHVSRTGTTRTHKHTHTHCVPIAPCIPSPQNPSWTRQAKSLLRPRLIGWNVMRRIGAAVEQSSRSRLYRNEMPEILTCAQTSACRQQERAGSLSGFLQMCVCVCVRRDTGVWVHVFIASGFPSSDIHPFIFLLRGSSCSTSLPLVHIRSFIFNVLPSCPPVCVSYPAHIVMSAASPVMASLCLLLYFSFLVGGGSFWDSQR